MPKQHEPTWMPEKPRDAVPEWYHDEPDELTRADWIFGLCVALSVVGIVFLMAIIAGWL